MKRRTPVVVVAYNRERSLKRLLKSLERADYPNVGVELLISIDYATHNQHILKIAEDFSWRHGKKTIIYQKENLGLRQHIIKCGNLSLSYGSVIVLEDDLFVSPNFYNYAISALEFSENLPEVGGISLYNHKLNVHTRDNFSSFDDGYDNWYFQFASSWGQAWSKNQWEGFMKWYSEKPNIDNTEKVPAYVRSWSEKSWLKYNIAYLVENQKYFLYPKISLSTNFSDAGTHVGNDSTIYQVPLLGTTKKVYSFSKPEDSYSVYDVFYENKQLRNILGFQNHEITIDLHGYQHKITTPYLLSSKILNHHIIRSFAKSLKPIDANIIYGIDGNELWLYDTRKPTKNRFKMDTIRAIVYNHKHINPKDGFRIYLHFWKKRMKKVFSFFGLYKT
ncbi:MAG: glycosyltransferase family A protein [Bacteroidota bacterium]